MDAVANLLEAPVESWNISADQINSIPNTHDNACQLWNLTIKLAHRLDHEKNSTYLSIIARLRLYACKLLSEYKAPDEVLKYWARTGKTFIDAGDYAMAEEVFTGATQHIHGATEMEDLFNFYFWKTELFWAQNKPETLSVLQQASHHANASDKLRLHTWTYNSIAIQLYKSKQHTQLTSYCELILKDLSNGQRQERTSDLEGNVQAMLCAAYLEIGNIAKAKEVLDRMRATGNPYELVLRLKVSLETESYEGIQDAINQIQEANLQFDLLLEIVDVLFAKNRLTEACKMLMATAHRYQTYAVYYKWLQVLFSLLIINGDTAQSLPYMNLDKVIEEMLSCSDIDIQQANRAIWEYAVELYYSDRHKESIEVVENYYLRNADRLERATGYLLIAQNLAKMESWDEALKVIPYAEGESLGVLLKVKILGRLEKLEGKYVLQAISSLSSFEQLSALAQEILVLEGFPELEDHLFKISEKLVSLITEDTIENLVHLMQLIFEKTTNPTQIANNLDIICSYLPRIKDQSQLRWFFGKAWNVAISILEPETSGRIIMKAYQIADFLKMSTEVEQCLILLINRMIEAGQDPNMIATYLDKVKQNGTVTDELKVVEFEYYLRYSPETALPFLTDLTLKSLPWMKTLASVALKYKAEDLASQCLKKYLSQIAPQEDPSETSAVYREIIRLAGESEEAYVYIENMLNVVTPEWPKDELEWILATSWNHGLKSYRIGALERADRWMSLALKVVQFTGDEYLAHMKDIYQDVMKQRYHKV